jgi:hypothetical protein
MYAIERTPDGFKLTFGGIISKSEMETWVEESKKILPRVDGRFSVVVDMRTLAPLLPDVQNVMVAGQRLYRTSGMTRSAVILNDTATTAQFQRLAKESGIDAWERYIDASATPNWMRVAEAWCFHGTEPSS